MKLFCGKPFFKFDLRHTIWDGMGYVFKNISKEDFIRSLQVVTMGGNYFSDKLALRSTPFSIHQQVREFKTLSTWKKLMVCGKLALEGATMLFF
ncbi:MAG: hypothetical protein RIC06_13315 [Cyclobacteriaceae bacterium]